MSNYILYGGIFTRALITEMVLKEAGIPYELRNIDIVANQHRSQVFLDINPSGLVPILLTPDGETLYEMHAINLFLVDHHLVDKLAPVVTDPGRGRFLSAYFYLAGELEPAMKRFFYPHRYAVHQSDTATVKQRAYEDVIARFAVINGRLEASGPYQLGERFSMLDIALSYWVRCSDPDKLFQRFPAMAECVSLVTKRPKLKGTFNEIEARRLAYVKLRGAGKGVI